MSGFSRLRSGECLLAVSGWLTLLISLGPHWPIRVVVVFAFTYLASGCALVGLLGLEDRLERAVLIVASSLSLAVAVTELLSLVHLFSATLSLTVLAAFTSGTVLFGARSRGASHSLEQTAPGIKR